MRASHLLPLIAAVALVAQAPAPKAGAKEVKAEVKATAEIKLGTAIEKMELQGEATTFKVAAGTKLYTWVKVAGAADSTITVAFSKGDRTTKQELKVPRSPYRTNAYRTFRKGDEGAWTVKVLAADGAELGTAAFTVEVE